MRMRLGAWLWPRSASRFRFSSASSRSHCHCYVKMWSLFEAYRGFGWIAREESALETTWEVGGAAMMKMQRGRNQMSVYAWRPKDGGVADGRMRAVWR